MRRRRYGRRTGLRGLGSSAAEHQTRSSMGTEAAAVNFEAAVRDASARRCMVALEAYHAGTKLLGGAIADGIAAGGRGVGGAEMAKAEQAAMRARNALVQHCFRLPWGSKRR